MQLDDRYALAPASLFYDKEKRQTIPCFIGGMPIRKYKYPAYYESSPTEDYNFCVFLIPRVMAQKKNGRKLYFGFDVNSKAF